MSLSSFKWLTCLKDFVIFNFLSASVSNPLSHVILASWLIPSKLRTSSGPSLIIVCSMNIGWSVIFLSVKQVNSISVEFCLVIVQVIETPSGYERGRINLKSLSIGLVGVPIITILCFSFSCGLILLNLNFGSGTLLSFIFFFSIALAVNIGSRSTSSVGIPVIKSELFNLKE